jgi:hypothetical protein
LTARANGAMMPLPIRQTGSGAFPRSQEVAMYLRIVHGRATDAGRLGDVAALGSDIVAAFRALPGFVGYQGGVDRQSGTVVGISTRDTAEHARVSRDALGGVVAKFQALGVQLDAPQVYEVAFQG